MGSGTGTDGRTPTRLTNGGTTAFSSATADASIEITPQVGSTISVASNSTDSDEAPPLLTAINGQGTSVVAWTDASGDLNAQFYNSAGAPIGSSFQINPAGMAVSNAMVTAGSNGMFAFAWLSTVDGSTNIYVRRYDNSATAVDAAPLVVGQAPDTYFNVAITGDGGLVLSELVSNGDGTDTLYAGQYASDGQTFLGGQAITTITLADTSVESLQISVAASYSAANDSALTGTEYDGTPYDGSFVVELLTKSLTDGSQSLQAMQFSYNSLGDLVNGDLLDVADWSSGATIVSPTVSVDGAGGFVTTWLENDEETGDYDLMARHFDSSGSAGAAFLITDTASATPDAVAAPSAAGAGNWGAIWASAVTGNLMGQFYNSEDESLGDEFEVASSGSGTLDASFALASNAQGNLLAAWSNNSAADGGNFNHDLYAQQLQVNPPPTVAAMPDLDAPTGDPETITLSQYFSASSGDSLSYASTSSDTDIATTSVSGNLLTLDYSSTNVGSAVITVTATDLAGNTVSTTFDVNVNEPAPTLESSSVTVSLDQGIQTFSVSQLLAGVSSSQGIAITGVNPSEGTLEYSTNFGGSGTTWNSVGTPTDSNALLLAANGTTELQFTPNNAYIGSINNAITFRAWNENTGTNGETNVDTIPNGEITAFSSGTAQAAFNITPMVGPDPVVLSGAALSSQPQVATAVSADGAHVVAWVDNNGNLQAMLYNSDGTTQGPFQVNTTAGDVQIGPVEVIAGPNGSFTFAWVSTNSGPVEVRRFQPSVDDGDTLIAQDASPIEVTGTSAQ